MTAAGDEDAGSLPSSRQEARRVGASRYFTGQPCKRAHLARRYTATASCVACDAERARRWTQTHRERKRGLQRASRARRPGANAAHQRAYRRDAKKWRTLLASPWRDDPSVAAAIGHVERLVDGEPPATQRSAE